MIPATMPDGTQIWVPQGTTGQVQPPGTGGGTMTNTAQPPPQQQPQGSGGGGAPGGGGTPADGGYPTEKLLDGTEKLDLDGYRALLIYLNPESPQKETLDDEVRAAADADLMNQALATKIKRDILLGMVIRAGAVLSEYERARLTRSALLARLKENRLE